MPDPNPDENANPFRDARLRGMDSGRIRRLRGFIKGSHHEPDRHSSAAESFVRKVGEADLEERAETLFRAIRTSFQLKRKDLDYTCEGGTAVIRTPDFTVTLWIDQDPEEAQSFQIGVEVGALTSRTTLLGPEFVEVFRYHCDTVLIDFAQTIDLEQTIDRLEDSDRLAPLLDYAADASWLTLKVPEPAVELKVLSHQASFSIPAGGDLRTLIEGTASLMEDLAAAGAGWLPEPE